MPAKYTLYPSRGGKWGFRLLAANGEIVLASQTYASKAGARKGAASVQAHCGDDACFERKKSSNGKPYFTLKARNGKVIARSEMYSSPAAMERGVSAVKRAGRATRVEDA